MGKVVAAVAVIGLAVAVAVAAPALAGLIAAKGTLAFTLASAAIAATMSVAAGAIMSALVPKPGTVAPGWEASGPLPFRHDDRSFKRVYDRAFTPQSLPPVDRPWWRATRFFAWERVTVCGTRGSCMQPAVPASAYVVLDRTAPIDPGDLFLFTPDDLGRYMRGGSALARWRCNGLVKRYLGVDLVADSIVYECTNPSQRLVTGRRRLVDAYRVVSCHDSWLAAIIAAHRHRAALRRAIRY